MTNLRRWLYRQVWGQGIRIPRKKRRGPWRSPEYRQFIRQFPCCACGLLVGIEASHTGAHGISQKAPDDRVIPLCRYHHREGPDALDRIGSRKFEEVHQISIAQIIAELNREWRLR